MPTDTRTRMIEAAVRALQQQGLAGMSFTDVLADSGAARGAIYHHFPRGKTELAAEAVTRNGADVRAHLATLPTGSPSEVVESFIVAVQPVLAASATGGGCAVAAVTVGDTRHDGDGLRDLAAATFRTWISTLADRLSTAGLPTRDAEDLATLLLTLLEGAHVLCRAARSLEPYEQIARTAMDLVHSRYPTPEAATGHAP
jgi:TetR/AcrR family transcriptional repressor of lmrAB and yxaGH operons